jgi:hypothetical protein
MRIVTLCVEKMATPFFDYGRDGLQKGPNEPDVNTFGLTKCINDVVIGSQRCGAVKDTQDCRSSIKVASKWLMTVLNIGIAYGADPCRCLAVGDSHTGSAVH